jgi:hypothetical protein
MLLLQKYLSDSSLVTLISWINEEPSTQVSEETLSLNGVHTINLAHSFYFFFFPINRWRCARDLQSVEATEEKLCVFSLVVYLVHVLRFTHD